ncbi:MAG: helix-turn-helix transcriptional regulator [Jatrophihabitantaceae bacterium]
MHTPPPALDSDALRRALSQLRNRRGLTYDQLAERSGVARSVLVTVETGAAQASLRTWHAIAHALDVPFADLMASACADHPDEPHRPRRSDR